jgi:hypothetical protein
MFKNSFWNLTLTMSKLLRTDGLTKLTTTFPLTELQAVPEWGAETVLRAPHSGGCSSGASSTSLGTNRTIDRAEPCFVTNASAYTHHQVHMISRGTSSLADLVVVSKSFIPPAILCSNFAGKIPYSSGYCLARVYYV